MITVTYTNESIENEPGPNLYWRGKPSDFLKLIFDLHNLGVNNRVEIELSKLDYIELASGHRIIVKASPDGNVLCGLKDDIITIDCTNSIWRSILSFFLSVSFFPSHNYVEFDNEDLIEDANFIISSEG